MPSTTNFNWTTPADTDLVKDGAAAIRTLANGIDTSLVDLKGGTTGQILSKNSNTDLDYIWINNDQGDITAVTAGTGLTGGGTTGAVTLTNDMATTITAAGDIVVGTGSGTYDNLPIGTTGQVLTADTTVSPYKVKWAAAAGGGKVLQVVSATYGVATTSTSTSWADTGLSASITPSATNSKVLIMTFGNYAISRASDDKLGGGLRLLRGATAIFGSETASGPADLFMRDQNAGGNLMDYRLWQSFSYLDSPSTTSSTTYKIQFACNSANDTFVAQYNSNDASIILLEIGA